MSKLDGEWSRVVAELGIGTNPRARLQGNLMTDEKATGTIHVAFGRNDMFGGANPAPVHIDCVVCRPTLHVDGERVDLPAGGRASTSTGWRAAGSSNAGIRWTGSA